MSLRTILIAPHPMLKHKAAPVARFDADLRRLLDDMLETMYAAPGIGLSAPQVGVLQRALVVDAARDGEARSPLRIVNPRLIAGSEERSEYEEGCLSFPGLFAKLDRAAAIELAYQDEDGEERRLQADGLLATVLQHEIDHLDGVLFLDRMSALRRNMLARRHAKNRKLESAR